MRYKYVLLYLLPFSVMPLFCNDLNDTHFGIYAGIGKINYFDNMQVKNYIAKEVYVDKSNGGASLKFVWEPEHRISIGLETGFYRMYSFNYIDNLNEIYRYLYVRADYIPLFLNVNMRIINNFSLGIGTSAIILMNATDAVLDAENRDYLSEIDIKSSTISMANYHVQANYIFPLGKNKKWQLGAEVRYLWIGKTNDHTLTYQALFGYRF